ncbi:YceH family protein [Pseudoalteromonas sp. MMG022]|uniref:YceH family protein n=1 Tax=Pseudoalteromonas sp. MMG022 TaxID=2909978 RepID=UPI001F331CB7|nr:YceH family protein [Pseudoalteromonas sp. MMG022]MCF6437316.1 YceH family protein [Pseudoalteromonas sp. MMG022]
MELSEIEQRIVGCLLEKQSTTPEHYPLSLNALTNACNQKSNRDPVLSLNESDVLDALEQLQTKHIVLIDEGLSGRVNKYSHRFCNTEFSRLQFSEQQSAIICLLLLRGPQTPGELRTRSARLATFKQVSEVEQALEELQSQGYVKKLAREPGKRESRFIHLFQDTEQYAANTATSEAKQLENAELDSLLSEIEQLKRELAEIKQHLGL